MDEAAPCWLTSGLDPDGYRVVIAVRDRGVAAPLQISWHEGERSALRNFFELAEDSAQQLESYLELGQLLVARRENTIIGHLQLVPAGTEQEIELKTMAARPEHQGTGVGRALVDAAVRHAELAGYSRMVAATATASTANIRF